jgi:hypothetical protein
METANLSNLVRFANALAGRLGVTRRTINRWLKLPGAPKKVNGRWNVWDWIEFVDAQGLNAGLLDRCSVAIKVAGLINERLPERVSRTTECVLLEVIETLLPYDRKLACAFHASAPSTESQAAESPRAPCIEEINPWSLPSTR